MANVILNFLGDVVTNVRSNLVTSNNYMGENYGYDKAGMDKVFLGTTIRNSDGSSTFIPPTYPGKLPANGTQYSIPTSLGGGIGTFNASDYTIRNSAGQVVGSINWSPNQPDQMGSNVIGSPRWPSNQVDLAGLAHDAGIGKAKETNSTDIWLKANDDLRTAALAISNSSTSTWAEKQDALVVLTALNTGRMEPNSIDMSGDMDVATRWK